MNDKKCPTPAPVRMLRTNDSFGKEPVDNEEDHSADIDEELGRHSYLSMIRVESPCYSKAHGHHSEDTETYRNLLLGPGVSGRRSTNPLKPMTT